MKLEAFPAFFLGMATTSAIALFFYYSQDEVDTAAQTSRELSEIHWIKHPEQGGWRFTGRERIPGQVGRGAMTVEYFQDVATGTCYARFAGYVEGVTWVPCEATDR